MNQLEETKIINAMELASIALQEVQSAYGDKALVNMPIVIAFENCTATVSLKNSEIGLNVTDDITEDAPININAALDLFSD